MLRQLPPTITSDQTPEWLPAGWICHSTILKRGRQTRTYTQLRTGKKFYTKDQVLEYINLVEVTEERESRLQRKKLKAFQKSETSRERASRLQDDWKTELKVGSFGDNPDTESSDMSGEPLKAQAAQEETATSSPEDLSRNIELGLDPQEKIIISGSKTQEKKEKTCSSKNIKEKDNETPTKSFQKVKKGSLNIEPNPNFPFELITSSFGIEEEDDSVIRRYLEEYYGAAGIGNSSLPLPDFGLPSFSDIKISLNEEPGSKKKKSPDPPGVQAASSS